MKTEAITKIEDGRKAYKGNRYGQVMAPYVAEILKDFCQQNEEFAQAVFQVYFTAVQEDCNRMMGLIKKAEPEQAEKFRKAMTALLGSVGNLLNE